MDSKLRLLKLCSKIVAVLCIIFILVDLLNGAYKSALILLSFSLVLLMPIFVGINRFKESFLCVYFNIGLCIVVFIVTTIEKDFIASIPLFICAGTISAIFFDTTLVKTGFFSAIILFVLEVVILSLVSGGLILDLFVIIECILAMVACFFLVHRSVSNGLSYMAQSKENEIKSKELLCTVNRKIEEEEISFKKSQHILKEIHKTSIHILAEANKLTSGSASLGVGATQQTDLVNKLSKAIQTISFKITETDDYAKNVRKEAENMNMNVETGSQKMNDMLAAVEEIHKSSVSIEKIIKAIESISFQTNILALNASVEAARAGSSGAGFAVVADEVRSLAAQSAQAAQNTTELLGICLSAINNGSKIAMETALALEHIGNSVNEVSSKTFMISDMTSLQMSMVSEINQQIEQVSNTIQSVANTAKETEFAGLEFQKQADNLNNLSQSI